MYFKYNEAPEIYDITAEIIKVDGERVVHEIHRIYNAIWKDRKWPTDLMQIDFHLNLYEEVIGKM